MSRLILPQDITTFGLLIQRCSAAKNLKKLQQMHAHTITRTIFSDDFIRSKLISAYISCSQFSLAHSIFRLCNRNSTFGYNSFIRGYNSIKQYDLSLDIFRQMMLHRQEIDSYTLPAVLKSVAAVSGLEVGRRVHGYALVRGFGSDLAHCNALISMYGKCGDLEYARKVFYEMRERDLVTWSAIMSVYGMHGEFDEVFWLFDTLVELVFELDAEAFTAVLTACRNGGRFQKGNAYFKMMTDVFKLRPSMEQCSCMVDLLGSRGGIEGAKEVIETIEVESNVAL